MKKLVRSDYFYKVLKYMLSFAIIPIILFSIIIGISQSIKVYKDAEANGKLSLETYVQNLSNNIMVIENNLNTITYDTQIVDIILNEQAGKKNYENELFVGTRLYNLNKNGYINVNYYILSNKDKLYKSFSKLIDEQNQINKKWYDDIIINGYIDYKIVEGSIFNEEDKTTPFLIGGKRIVDFASGNSIGVCVAEINLNHIDVNNSVSSFEKLYKISDEIVFIGEYGDKTEDKEKIQESNKEIKYWLPSFGLHETEVSVSDDGIVLSRREPVSNLLICGQMSTNAIESNIFLIFLLVIVMILILIGIAILFSIKFTVAITSPIRKICDGIDKVSAGDLSVTLDINSSQEYKRASRHFNKMVVDIKGLIDKVYQEQNKRRKYEFMLLQAQINPHFLYNTLDSIIWLIRMERYEESIEMINALTLFLRTGLNKGSEVISLGNEIANVDSYMKIQKLRYKNAFTYEIDVPEEMRTLATPKLILQPLVENALYHGVKNLKDKGFIHIYGYQEGDKKIIVVADTGEGMSEEKIAEIMSRKTFDENNDSYGLTNVIERLKLFYKDKVEFEIKSKHNEGTMMIIKIKG